MSQRRFSTPEIFLGLIALWALGLAPALLTDRYLDTPVAIFLLMPFLSVYLFHVIGIPGLLENNGACGWGWCAPTVFGWVFVAAVWLALLYGVAALISRMFGDRSAPGS